MRSKWLLPLLLLPSSLSAQVGAAVGLAPAGYGVRAQAVTTSTSQVSFGVNLFYFEDYEEVNANVYYNFFPDTTVLVPYIGGGLNFATKTGINVVSGINLHVGSMVLFTEGKIEMDGGEQMMILIGFRLR